MLQCFTMYTHAPKIKLLLTLLLLCFMQFAVAKDEISLEQASESIRKESKGQVVSATTSTHKGVKTHRIKVLTKSGRVKVYNVPVSKNGSSKEYNNRYNQSKESKNSTNYRNKTSNNNSKNRKTTTSKKQKAPQSRKNTNRQNTYRSTPSRRIPSRSQPTKSQNTSSSKGGTNKQ